MSKVPSINSGTSSNNHNSSCRVLEEEEKKTVEDEEENNNHNSSRRLSIQESNDTFHRRRTLYLVRHGEALHNVLEAKAQEEARQECLRLNLSKEETLRKMEQARQDVLKDTALRDAPLTPKGQEQAKECARRLNKLLQQEELCLPPPSEAMVSPLTRTLQTCNILLDQVQLDHDNDDSDDNENNNNNNNNNKPQVKAHIRHELQERQTQLPPDTARSHRSILRYSEENEHFLCYANEAVRQEDIQQEASARESKEMLRERASKLFDLLLEMNHLHILIVSHKGYLRELERGLLRQQHSPLFDNAELRVYRVVFTRGDRVLESIERVA